MPRPTFHGQVGSSYKFYSIATDNAGHIETTPGEYDASTLVTVGVEDFEMAKEKLLVYPNPAQNILQVKMLQAPAGVYVVDLTDADGGSKFSQIYRQSELSGGVTIDLKGFAPGVYFLKVIYGDNMVTQKVMLR